MGRMGETCGAVTGALMIVGLTCGQKDLNSRTAKEKTYRLARKFIREFRGRNTSIVCFDLLGFRLSQKNDLSPDEIKSIMKKCPKYVQDASEILQEILET
jgi:C_GCAxxG_C_C family probable redox protein